MFVALCATGISLPDDIQLSLTAEETDLIAEHVGSPDSQQSTNRLNEAGCVLHYLPVQDR